MKTYHLFLLLKTVHEASPADDLLSSGFTPGQLSGLIIEATRAGLLERDRHSLFLSEKGKEQLKAFRAQSDRIRPDGQWIKMSRRDKVESAEEAELYVPRPKLI